MLVMNNTKVNMSQVSEIVGKCITPHVSSDHVETIIYLFSDTVSSLLARDNSVTIPRLGKFYTTESGTVKFSQSKTFKERVKTIRQKLRS